jgi:ATP-binding cassette, subfamily F, member 3
MHKDCRIFRRLLVPTLQLESVSLAFGDRDILSSASLHLSENSRTALAGANGSGKSTLMKIISGLIKPDSGTIHTSRGARITYLPQSDYILPDTSVYAAADEAFSYYHDMQAAVRSLESSISQQAADHSSSGDSVSLEPLLHEHHYLNEKLLNSGYFQREARIYHVLQGLGFSAADVKRSCREFSGGWQMRIALAKVLLEQADFLLLDEPTNYLDVEARIWLKNYISRYKGGILVVSHDRDFLDDTVNSVEEIFQGTLSRYAGNYSSFEKQREQRNEQLIKLYEQQQNEIQRIEQFIERFRYKESKARQVQSRVSMLEKIERIELPENLKKIRFSFPPGKHSGNQIFIAESLSKSYGAEPVLSNLKFSITKGDRIAVSGKNGAGKSTLLRILAGADQTFDGELREGSGVSIGYFAQDSDKSLTGDLTVYEELEKEAPTGLIPKLRSYLGSFLFRGDDIFKSVSILSGGEKSRLALLKLLLKPYNVLVLDEPTNHLDLSAKDVLLEALKSFTGTLIFVSHDSYFIRNLANRIFYMSEAGMEIFEGEYEYFAWVLEKRNQYIETNSQANEQNLQSKDIKRPDRSKSGISPASGLDNNSIAYKNQNAVRNRIKSLRKQAEVSMEEIENIERHIATVNMQMADPENYQNGNMMKKLTSERTSLERALEKEFCIWEETHQELEELEHES